MSKYTYMFILQSIGCLVVTITLFLYIIKPENHDYVDKHVDFAGILSGIMFLLSVLLLGMAIRGEL